MTIEVLMISFAGGLFLIVCALVVFIFVSLQKKVDDFKASFDEFKHMLDSKLTQLGHALSAIDKDLRSEIFVLDRRTTRLEAETHSRREEDGK